MQLVLTDNQDVEWNLAGRELHCDVRLRFNNAQADNVAAHYQLVTGKLQISNDEYAANITGHYQLI